MADAFATKAAQIIDNSQEAGRTLINILANKNDVDPFLRVANIVQKAEESQRLSEAIDGYNRAIKAGKSDSAALQGLNQRITGSDEFQDFALKLAQDQNAKETNRISAMNAATQRAQVALAQQKYRDELEDAKLVAMYNLAEKTSAGGGDLWIRDNMAALKAHPGAMKTIMSGAKALDFSDGDEASNADPAKAGFVNATDIDQLNANLTNARDRIGGTYSELYGDPAYKSNTALLERVNKNAGDSGKQGSDNMTHINETMALVASGLAARGLDVAPEVMRKTYADMVTQPWYSFLSDKIQPTADADAIINKIAGDDANIKYGRKLDDFKTKWGDLKELSKQATAANANYALQKSNLASMLARGEISQESFNRLMNRLNRNYNTFAATTRTMLAQGEFWNTMMATPRN